jgi:hypothetical protein
MKRIMDTKLFFARAMTLALVAGGLVASLPTEAMATNRTWTNGSALAGNNRQKWGTTAQFATNWSSVGVNTFANPTSADTAVFLGNNGASPSITIQSANVPVGKMTFGGTTQYSFTGTSVALFGDGLTPNVGISNDASGKTQTFAGVTVSSGTIHANSTAGGTLSLSSVDLQGNTFAVGGAANVTKLTGSAGSTYEAKSGSQSVAFANGNAVGTLKVSGATVSSSGDRNGTFLDIQGGSYGGSATFLRTSITGGQFDLSDGYGLLDLLDTTGATYSQGAAGLTKMRVGYDGTDPLFSTVITYPGAGFSLGGGLLLNGAGMTSTPLAVGLTWDLFQGVNFTSGSASLLNNPSNFLALVLEDSGSGSPYAGAFTLFGQGWRSPTATDGTYLEFQAASGNLVVVAPEPPSGVPEIDPAMGSSALSLVAGVLAMIEQRRRRAALVA